MNRARPPVLLIVDDEDTVANVIERFASGLGFDVCACASGAEAIARLQSSRADVMFVDLHMPGIGGLDVIKAVRQADPHCEVVLISGNATIDSVVEAVKLGARDCLAKPFDFDRLRELLAAIRDDLQRRRSIMVLEGQLTKQLEFCGMVGRSPVMTDLFAMIRRLAPHMRCGLVTGETGTGKELVARAFHVLGPRRDRPFVAINCSAIVETLVESELFGHMRGAFTGAAETRAGVFERAHGGTLFLDEIGELPLAMQAKMLRVLETGEIQRVGGGDTRRVDVRVIAATNRDLTIEAAAGRFRSDLLYRLNMMEVHLPPLRDRREDIPYLAHAFIREMSTRLEKRLIGTSPGAEQVLLAAPWPGNVRELRNVLERACILTETEFVTERDLASLTRVPMVVPVMAGVPVRDPESLASLEREHIVRTLERTKGNKQAAARVLGLSRRALYRRLERFGLTAPER